MVQLLTGSRGEVVSRAMQSRAEWLASDTAHQGHIIFETEKDFMKGMMKTGCKPISPRRGDWRGAGAKVADSENGASSEALNAHNTHLKGCLTRTASVVGREFSTIGNSEVSHG
jgi:hypothetical protein